LANYFLEISYGRYWLESAAISDMVTIDGLTTDFQLPAFLNDWTRNTNLHQQICQGATGIDWTRLDVNSDCRITSNEAQVCFMAAIGGGGAERPSTVQITYNDITYDIAQRFVFFDCLPENDSREATQGNIRYNFSTIIHELLHGLFNLPDRYVGIYCGTGGTGAFDPMSDNCRGIQHINMHDKIKIGWIRPKILMRDTGAVDCFSFPASETTQAALILNPIFSTVNGVTQCEYWIIENRFIPASTQRWDGAGWDADFPESGLCVWYVRDIPGQKDEVHLVDASKADGDPLLYIDQIEGALFKDRPGAPVGSHGLYLGGGAYAGLGFGFASAEGATMFAEF
jgi:M6 family metalloprotease-like protein